MNKREKAAMAKLAKYKPKMSELERLPTLIAEGLRLASDLGLIVTPLDLSEMVLQANVIPTKTESGKNLADWHAKELHARERLQRHVWCCNKCGVIERADDTEELGARRACCDSINKGMGVQNVMTLEDAMVAWEASGRA